MVFEWKWADEDTGYNTGEIICKKGNMYKYQHKNQSQEALSLYVELWGRTSCLSKDGDGNWKLEED